MLDDWQQRQYREKLWHLAIEIQRHANSMLDTLVLNQQQDHLRNIQHATQQLMAMATLPISETANPHTVAQPQDGTPPSSAMPQQHPASAMPQQLEQPHKSDSQKQADVFMMQNLKKTESQASHARHILLVEDNPFTQKLMTRLLTHHDYKVTVASHGQEALTLLNTSKTLTTTGKSAEEGAEENSDGNSDGSPATVEFHVILMDIRMPIMDGLKTTMAIRHWEAQLNQRNQPVGRIPIIAVTALIHDDDRDRALHAGVDAFHGKPIQANKLFAEIERLAPALPASLSQEPEPNHRQEATSNPTPNTKEASIKIELDLRTLLKTVEYDRELLREVIDLYQMDAPEHIRNIDQGIKHNDAHVVQEAAHALKGASGAFGKNPAYDLAFNIEQMGRAKDLSQAALALEQLQQAVTSLEYALHEELNKNSKPE